MGVGKMLGLSSYKAMSRGSLVLILSALLLAVTVVTYSRNNPWFVAATLDGVVLCPMRCFSPVENHILTIDEKFIPHIWNLDSGGRTVSIYDIGPVRTASFSPSGKYIVLGTKQGLVSVRKAIDGHEVMRRDGHKGEIHTAIFSEDERYIVTGGADATVRLWRAHNGQLIKMFGEAHTSSTILSAWCTSSFDKCIAVEERKGMLHVWDIETGTQKRMVKGYFFCLPGQMLHRNMVFHNGAIENILTGKVVASLDYTEKETLYGNFGVFSPDGRLVAARKMNGSISIWDATELRSKVSFPCLNEPLAVSSFSPDGNKIAVAGPSSRILVWDVLNKRKLGVLPNSDGICFLMFSPRGQCLVVSTIGWDDTNWKTKVWRMRFPPTLAGHFQRLELWVAIVVGILWLWSLGAWVRQRRAVAWARPQYSYPPDEPKPSDQD